jgi:hypothetical protein
MADDGENQAAEQETPETSSGDEPKGGDVAESDRPEPQDDFESSRKRRARGRRKRSAKRKKAELERKKSERRFTLATAAISATAAILGAGVGGLFSYLASHTQSTAQADAALISRRQSTYSDYISQISDLADSEGLLVDALLFFHDHGSNSDQVRTFVGDFNNVFAKVKHTDHIVILNDSDAVDDIRNRITNAHIRLFKVISGEVAHVFDGQTTDPDALEDALTSIAAIREDELTFVRVARNDVKQPTRNLWPLN